MNRTSSRPNLLLLQTDQQRWDAIGMVRTEVKTPHLDALAARGIHFDQAVCQNPQCVASRYSMTTGLYPSQVGVRNNNQAIHRDEDLPVPTIFQRLQDLGYQTIGSGKTHWYMHRHEGRDTPPIEASNRGFDHRFMGRRSGGYDQEPGAIYFSEESPENMGWMADYTKKVGPTSGGESFEGYMGCADSRPAELVDIAPTLLDAAGERIPDELPGESLLHPSHRLGSFAEFHSHGFDNILWAPAYMWRTTEWKLILFFDGNLDELRRHPDRIQGELFDLKTDPREYCNLYGHPEHREQQETLTRNLLVQLMINHSHFPRHASYSYNRPKA